MASDFVQAQVAGLLRSSAWSLAAAVERKARADAEMAASVRWVEEEQSHFDEIQAHLLELGGDPTGATQVLEQRAAMTVRQVEEWAEVPDRELLRR